MKKKKKEPEIVIQNFVFRDGARITGVDPNTVGLELERIRKTRAGLTPKSVVAEAEPVTSPLHNAFEWDNNAAGNLYREYQARNLIRSVHVVVEGDPTPKQVYVHIRGAGDEGNKYEAVDVVIDRPDMFIVALEELVSKMNAATRAVRQLENAAATAKDKDRVAMVKMAVHAIKMANEAVRALH